MQFILWRLAVYTAALLSYVSTSDRIMFDSIMFGSLDWQSKFGNTNVPLQTPIELSNHRAEIYAL